MARRSDHSREEIKNMAIDAALALVSAEGVEKLSARKVAKAIGYTPGTLYLVFKNFDELILHVNALTLEALRDYMRLQMGSGRDPQQQILNGAAAYLDYAQQNPARWSLLFYHRLPADIPIPDWFNEKVAAIFVLVESALLRLKPDIEPHSSALAARVLWSGVHGACELLFNNKLNVTGSIAAEQVVDSLVRNYLTGLLRAEGLSS